MFDFFMSIIDLVNDRFGLPGVACLVFFLGFLFRLLGCYIPDLGGGNGNSTEIKMPKWGEEPHERDKKGDHWTQGGTGGIP